MPQNISYNMYPKNQLPPNFQGGAIDTIAENAADGGILKSMIKSMGVPTNGDEFVKDSPFIAGGVASVWGSLKFVDWLTKNKLPADATTAEAAMNNSRLFRWGKKLDDLLTPMAVRVAPHTDRIKTFFIDYTPKPVKNLLEKMNIGVRPKWSMAKFQVDGMSHQMAEHFISSLKELPPSEIEKLGVKTILRNLGAEKINNVQALNQIFEQIKGKTVQELSVSMPRTFKLPFLNAFNIGTKTINLVDLATKAKAFAGKGAQRTITSSLQKFILNASEAIGGAITGGAMGGKALGVGSSLMGVFGIAMNAFMIKETIKKTWEAPKGEKLSTFMESFWGDFVGGFLMLFPASNLLYKALGIKNIDKVTNKLDKSTDQIKAVTRRLKNIDWHKNYSENVGGIIEQIKQNGVTDDILKQINERLKISRDLSRLKDTPDDLIKFLQKPVKSKVKINALIDEAAKAQEFKIKFKEKPFEWLIKKPISIIGNIFSTGLEMLPAKLAVKTADKATTVSKLSHNFGTGKNYLKGGVGAVIRFGLIMMVLAEPFRRVCVKASHLIFGKPTKSILDEEKTAETPKNSNIGAGATKVPMKEFIKVTNKNQPQAAPQAQPISTQPAQVQPAAASLSKDKDNSEPERTYNPDPIVTKTPAQQQVSGKIEQSLAISDKWEKEADRILGELHSK